MSAYESLQIGSGLDTSDATATADQILKGATAYVKGEKITGTHECDGVSLQTKTVTPTKSVQNVLPGSGYDGMSQVTVNAIPDNYIDTSDADASAENIAKGKTAYVGGAKITGTHECVSSTPTLQSKSVTPSESAQTVTPDTGYDGLSEVSVGAISKTYVGSGITKKSAATYTPGTSDQTIESGQYLNGAQTIKGDSNLIASNIKSGVSIFGVSGTYKATSSSGGDSTLNAEVQTISSVTSPSVTFNGSGGTYKVYGYGKGTTSGYTTPMYAFCGDKYYKSASYGSHTSTNMTISVDSSGNISGLPSLTDGELIIVREP